MDPAFSLADELVGVSNDDSYGHAYYHDRHQASLGDEFDGVYANEMEGDDTILRPHEDGGMDDLASELQDVLGGNSGNLGDELGLHGRLVGHTHAGSLADELEQQLDISRTASQASSSATANYASAWSSTPLGYDTGVESVSSGRSGASSPTFRSKSSLSRTSMLSSPSSRPSSTFLSTVPSTDVNESVRSTEHFLHQLATLSSASAGLENEAETSSDTAKVEQLAAKLLKLAYQCTLEREVQIRELRDLERQASRLPSGVHDFTLSSSSSNGYGPSTSKMAFPSGCEGEGNLSAISTVDYDAEESDDGEDLRDAVPTTPTAFRRKPLRKTYRSTASLASDITVAPDVDGAMALDTAFFTDLYVSTGSLLSSLTNLHEHAQVTKSNVTDAARKLKSARNILAQYRTEDDSVEQSLVWIQQHVSQQHLPTNQHTSVKSWTDEQVEYCKTRLHDVDSQARMLLTPVSLIS